MGQAVSTINAADKGITAITFLVEQAKGIAQSVQSAESSVTVETGDITLNAIVGYKGLVQTPYDVAVLTLTGLQDNNPGGDGDSITLDIDGTGGAYPVAVESGVLGYYSFPLVSGDMNATAQNMANTINSIDWDYWYQNVNASMDYYTADYLGGNQLRNFQICLGPRRGQSPDGNPGEHGRRRCNRESG